VCDNAKANRALVERVFGSAVVVKQDPFHVIARFTEKVRDSAKKKWLAVQRSAAIYDLQRNLRPPRRMRRSRQVGIGETGPRLYFSEAVGVGWMHR
jgi:hypothetical protein